jgi:penicillin-binding protein 1A
MLRETLLSGTGRKAELPGIPAAGKTGTTQEHRDAWFVGYSASLVAAIWVGNDDGEPMRKVSGSGLPAEIWADFMKGAHQGQKPSPLPGAGEAGGLVSVLQPGAARPPAQVPPPMAGRDNPGAWGGGPSAEERGLLTRLFGR